MNTAAAQWSENTVLKDNQKVYAGQQEKVWSGRGHGEPESGGPARVPGRAYDEFVRTEEKSAGDTAGIYRLTRDEDGSPKIVFEDPDERGGGKAEEAADAADAKANGTPEDEKPEQTVTVNTDWVDAEIRELKADYQKLKERLKSAAAGDPEGKAELERQLAEIEMALSEKDNDAYRKQHAVYTYGGGMDS